MADLSKAKSHLKKMPDFLNSSNDCSWNAKQCHERYKNYLNPSLDQGTFKKHGAKWNTIA
jgi:uncharacterized protein YabN with tetrapyrrole methylase and pyrophosphatase domain